MERNILEAIIMVSEKAANIARAIRHEDHLLSLLVREKKDGEKNQRFFQDFKTLADVLVQEVVKHDLGTEFPELVGHIYGEETNEFSCLDGEMVTLEVDSSEKDTFQKLVKIVGDDKVASSLASLVHSTVSLPDVDVPANVPSIPLDEIGIWIDPIDSTAEYISGGEANTVEEVCTSGLPCVTVLIGAFLKTSGLPVIGVVNQPFGEFCDERWKGNVMWGVSYEGVNLSFVPTVCDTPKEKVVVLSRFENEDVKARLAAGGYSLVEAAGAGYKLMCVVRGLVSAYVLTKPSTFQWDTCAVHAILRARGGGVVDYSKAVAGEIVPLTYQGGVGVTQCSHSGGFIGFSSDHVRDHLLSLLV